MRFDDVKNGQKCAGITTRNNSLNGGKSINRRRFGRGAAAGLAAFACVAGFFATNTPAYGAPVNLSVDISVASDGTPTWSASPTAGEVTNGYDAGPNNGVVRVNDTITYQVDFAVNSSTSSPANDVTLIIKFPQGTQMSAVPTLCGAGSTVAPTSAGLTLPIDNDSFGKLKEQTLTCKLGNFAAEAINKTQSLQFTVKVLNAAANNQPIVFSSGSVQITAKDSDSGVDLQASDTNPALDANNNSTTVLASSRLMWDLSKNSIQLAENNGRYITTNIACPWDTTVYCKIVDFPLNLSAPDGGKGAMPAVGDVLVTDDLSPASLFPTMAADNDKTKNLDTLQANLAKYGVRLYLFNSNPASFPGWTGLTNYVSTSWFNLAAQANGVQRVKNATLSSAADSNAVAAKDNIPVNSAVPITISGGDYSLLKPPTIAEQNQPLPDPSIAYVLGADVVLLVPFATINDLGECSDDQTTCTLTMRNTYTGLTITGLKDFNAKEDDNPPQETISGQPGQGHTDSQGNPDGTWNDYREIDLTLEISGALSKAFVGEPGNPSNTPSSQYNPSGNGFLAGPAGGWTMGTGQVRVTAGETVLSRINVSPPATGVVSEASYLACDSWDNSTLYMKATDYSTNVVNASNTTRMNGGLGSNGDPVWWLELANSAQGGNNKDAAKALLDNPPVLTIQYSPAKGTSSGTASNCGEAQGPWFDTPEEADAYANVSEIEQDGSTLYPGVGRVRIYFIYPAPPSGTSQASWAGQIAITMQVADNLQDGTTIPNYLAQKVIGGSNSFDDMTKECGSTTTTCTAVPWTSSDFSANPYRNYPHGDKLTVTTALTRVSEQVTRLVWNSDSGAYEANGEPSASTPLVMAYADGTRGDQALFTLQPTLTDASSTPGSTPTKVTVEDCLDPNLAVVSASWDDDPTFTWEEMTSPSETPSSDATITCTTGTYIRFVLNVKTNTPIPPIQLLTMPSATATQGSALLNPVTISSSADTSPVSVRQASASVTLSTVAGVQLLKQAVTPVVQVNRPDINIGNVDSATNTPVNQPMVWDVTMRNNDSKTPPQNIDIIDILPFIGDGSSAFHGTLAFDNAVAIAGGGIASQPVKIFYTSTASASLSLDNTAQAGTVWCTAPVGGIADTTLGAAGACPTSPAQVTALRIMRTGPLANQEAVTVEITMIGTNNQAGDTYVAQARGHASNLSQPVGPIDAPITAAGATLGGVVWEDVNGDGLRDADNEPLITTPVKVWLTGTDGLGNTVETSATTAGGAYSFVNLRSGTYTVKIDKPEAAANFTVQDKSGTGSLDYNDSDVAPATGEVTVTLGQGAKEEAWDAGIYWNATIGNKVWQDINGNGTQDDSDNPGVAGVKVCISGDTGATDADDNPVKVTAPDGSSPYCVTTGTDGTYSFSVPPSSTDGYTVTFDASNVSGDPSGISFTQDGQGENITVDSDAVVDGPDDNPLIGAVTGIFVESNEVNNDIDAGLVGTVTPVKSADPSEGSAVLAGATIDYTLTFTNDTAAGVEINYTDDLSALLDDADLTTQPSSDDLTVTMSDESFTVTGIVPAGEMVNGEWTPTTFTVTYTVTIKSDESRAAAESDSDGVIGNWVYPTPGEGGDTPEPPDYTTPDGQVACLSDPLCTAHFIPSISITKHGDGPDGDAVVGDTVTWDFTVENTGPVALTSFVLTDDQMAPDANFTWGDCVVRPGAEDDEITISADIITAGEPITDVTLQPGEQIVCSGTSQVTQADIDQAGQPNPNVTVTAISVPPTDSSGTRWMPTRGSSDNVPTGTAVEDESAAGVGLKQHADISLTKTVDKAEAALNDVVTFTITAKNTGNTTLINVTFDDPLKGLSELNCTWPDADAPGTLLVDEEVVCTATYTVTAADVANGGVKNVATVTGYTPDIPNPDDPDGKPTPGTPVTATADAAVIALTAPTGGYVAGNSAAGWLAVGLLLAVCGLMLGGAVVRRRHC